MILHETLTLLEVVYASLALCFTLGYGAAVHLLERTPHARGDLLPPVRVTLRADVAAYTAEMHRAARATRP